MKSPVFYKFNVNPENASRIDKLIASELPEYSRTLIQTWIKNGSANKILQYNGQRTEQAREFIKNSTSTDIWQFINSPQQYTNNDSLAA